MSDRAVTGACAPAGFFAGAVSAGIGRRDRLDVGVLVSERPASVAALYTTNRVQAAPLVVCREHVIDSGGVARAIVVNAGNANACTGAPGLDAARRTAAVAAERLGCREREVLVSSTGVIGQRLPVERLLDAVPRAIDACGDGEAESEAFARSILTTDTRIKQSVRRFETSSGTVTVGGVAKGSGMIHPDMATTLAFVTTDAACDATRLQRMLADAAGRTFNRITVDGDTSTNDFIAVLAGGASGVEPEAQSLARALEDVLGELAREVVRDGEGATKLVTVHVTGAEHDRDALEVARTVAGSLLVRTAIHGADANWGRVVAAVGRARAVVDPDAVSVSFAGVATYRSGVPLDFSEDEARERLSRDEVEIAVDLGLGDGRATTWTCDLSADYVRINASYRS